MQRYVTLADGNKHNRRSVADAIDLLTTHADFRASSLAKISTLPLPLAAKKPLFQLCIAFENLAAKVTFLVWLPTSSRFKAKGLHQRRADEFETADLNDASIDFDGNVVLATGVRLRAVEVIPTTLPYELSDLEWRILKCTIQCMKIEDNRKTAWLGWKESNLDMAISKSDALACSRGVAEPPLPSEFTSISKHSNFESRTESAESRALERNESFGEEGADFAAWRPGAPIRNCC